MPFCEVLQLELPEPFPVSDFEAYYRAARRVIPEASDHRHEFNGAMNIVAWRLRGCIEHARTLVSSWKKEGPRSFESLYVQERNLFKMLVCGVSAVEATCYSGFALVAAVNPAVLFDEKARRSQSSPKALVRVAPEGPLRTAAKTLVAAREWALWNEYRNTMAHRTSVPRLITGVGDGSLPPPPLVFEYTPTCSTRRLDGNEDEVARQLIWLCAAAKELFVAGRAQAMGA